MTTPADQPRIPRRVSNDHGTWDVIHPFSGKVEFFHTDKDLADAVAAEFDKHSPVSIGWLFDASIMHRVEHGDQPACWVMAQDTLVWLRRLKTPWGEYVMGPPASLAMPDHMLGLPIQLDESAVGVTLRDRTAA